AHNQDELDIWLNELEKYENCPPEGIYDSNGLKSYGGLCFQLPTFKQYVSKYIPESKDWEDVDWLDNIMDTDLQKWVAKQMILEKYDNYTHWKTSIKRGLRLPPKNKK
ncbi:MAG: hypothetical protein QW076_02480, partial [Candidatus Anstonellales archaeon]